MTVWCWTAVCADEVLNGRRWHAGDWRSLADEVATEIRLAGGCPTVVSVTVWPATRGSSHG